MKTVTTSFVNYIPEHVFEYVNKAKALVKGKKRVNGFGEAFLHIEMGSTIDNTIINLRRLKELDNIAFFNGDCFLSVINKEPVKLI
ncbi:MAG TPA: hypothetical protein PKV22_00080 [Paludibacteraceae bacterium]|nr:hypothetical protein [Paludibacteraceae bacterium]